MATQQIKRDGDFTVITTQYGEPRGKTPTLEEAEAILTLVRGGWLKLELTDCARITTAPAAS